MMDALHGEHPQYGWIRNKGYGTAEHLSALGRHGVTPHHRRSFAPVHNILWAKKSEDSILCCEPTEDSSLTL
jgi:ribonuclease HII